MRQIVVVGEGMVELSRDQSRDAMDMGEWRGGYGGDTLNTAIHLARSGERVGFLTVLGGDPFSVDLGIAWRAEGLDPAMLLVDPARTVGLYAITTDAAGERSFAYWRETSAARGLFAHPDLGEALAAAERADLLVFSLISLAILPAEGRTALLELAGRVRDAGGQVAFDGNYRERLWRDGEEAREVRDRAIAHCTIGLPTLEDEIALDGATDAEAVAARWEAGGAGEVVVKMGAEGCLVPGRGRVAPARRLQPVDTSGAGDAFNAGYLRARLAGAEPDAAALVGHALAGWVVMRRGAVPSRDAEAPYSR